MKILWLDINSSYSHSSVALPAIHAQVSDRKEWEWCVVRGTINDNPASLAASVAENKPDVIAATFWLFTHNMQIEVLSRAVQLIDNVKIVCGGPEFLGDNEEFLRRHRFVTAIIRGEGESSLPTFLERIGGSRSWESVDGLCWISPDDGIYRDNGIARAGDFACLRYPEESIFFKWDKPFVQLETTRGCFNTCAFCVSGGEKPVRSQSIEQVRTRLADIHSHGIKDVRVLDRTFNYDIERACLMLDLFQEYSGKMRFHLEIHPSLISDKLKEKLASLPAGLLHLEAGIQSLDADVLAQSGRKGSLDSTLEGLKFLCSLGNVQTHADLIAGLPGYSLKMLCEDVRKLAGLGVAELQMESLKVLPGTQMRHLAESKGLKYSPLPPYEVLMTREMTPQDLRTAMQVSRMVDLYYNSDAWQNVTRDLICSYPHFMMDFTLHLRDLMVLDSPVSMERRGVLLYEYIRETYPERLSDVSAAWIEGGFSLKKAPAGKIMKIKHLDAFLEENGLMLDITYGEPDPTHRYYLMHPDTSDTHGADISSGIIFGYDSRTHQPFPAFRGKVLLWN